MFVVFGVCGFGVLGLGSSWYVLVVVLGYLLFVCFFLGGGDDCFCFGFGSWFVVWLLVLFGSLNPPKGS